MWVCGVDVDKVRGAGRMISGRRIGLFIKIGRNEFFDLVFGLLSTFCFSFFLSSFLVSRLHSSATTVNYGIPSAATHKSSNGDLYKFAFNKSQISFASPLYPILASPRAPSPISIPHLSPIAIGNRTKRQNPYLHT